MYPFLQLTIDLWNTTTPNRWSSLTLSFTPPSDHRSMELHYTKLWVKMTLGFTPPPVDHRYMEHHYTESFDHPDINFYPLQSTIDLWNTATLNLWIMMTLSFTPW